MLSLSTTFFPRVDFPCVPALSGAVVGRLERVPDSQDECSAPLVCKVKRQASKHSSAETYECNST